MNNKGVTSHKNSRLLQGGCAGPLVQEVIQLFLLLGVFPGFMSV